MPAWVFVAIALGIAGVLPLRAQEELRVAVVPQELRALYLPSHAAAGERFEQHLTLLGTSAVNALVIDLKDANGRLAFTPENPALARFAPIRPTIRDLKDRVARIHAAGGYAIARIPVFQDSWYAERVPSEAIRASSGAVWRDGIGMAWLDPVSPGPREYAIALAREAKALDFDEVNFDYIRFPSDGPGFSGIRYPRWDGKMPRREVIAAFARTAGAQLHAVGIRVSADVFGLVCLSSGDLGIGQHLETLAPHFDVLAPMVYPSHYRSGSFGKRNPAQYPYEVVYGSLVRCVERVAALSETQPAVIRPWIQDFDLGAPYGPKEVRAQQQAGSTAGAVGWMVWNPRASYSGGESFRSVEPTS